MPVAPGLGVRADITGDSSGLTWHLRDELEWAEDPEGSEDVEVEGESGVGGGDGHQAATGAGGRKEGGGGTGTRTGSLGSS